MNQRFDFQISGVRILKEIGQGGMGTIYLGYHVELEQTVVVKLARLGDLRLESRLRKEVAYSLEIKHKNVVKYINLGRTDDGRLYGVMEHIEGLSLRQRIDSQGPLDYELGVEILKDILTGLGAIHDHGYIHRDLSPMNIMLRPRVDRPPQAIIIDLGVAKSIGSRRVPLPPHTSVGDFVGNPHYSAPEQWHELGRLSVSNRTDIFQIGILAYEMLTGQKPIPPMRTVRNRYPEVIPFEDSDRYRRVPRDLSRLVMKALEKDPEQRFKDTQEFLEALEKLPDPEASTQVLPSSTLPGTPFPQEPAGVPSPGEPPTVPKATLAERIGCLLVATVVGLVLWMGLTDGFEFQTSPGSGITFSGSATLGQELVPQLIEGYLESKGLEFGEWVLDRQGGRRLAIVGDAGTPEWIFVEDKGSSTGFSSLLERRAQVAMSSRPIKNGERARLVDAGIGSFVGEAVHVVALDGLAVIVHPDNPVKQLKLSQIADLFSGKTARWADLGGANRPVCVLARGDRSGAREAFDSLVLAPFGMELTSRAELFESSSMLSQRVSSEIDCIGFVGQPFLGEAAPVQINECGLTYGPSSYEIKTEEYPLTRRLFLYVPDNPSLFVSEFLDFVHSTEGQAVVREAGFTDLGIEADPGGHMRRLLSQAYAVAQKRSTVAQRRSIVDQYGQFTREAERLSVILRFEPGDMSLDDRADRDLERIVEFMQRGAGRRRDMLLLGFADSVGRPERNLELSSDRVRSARVALRNLGLDIPLRNLGRFGEEVPVACNDFAEGRLRNRRVEVWVR